MLQPATSPQSIAYIDQSVIPLFVLVLPHNYIRRHPVQWATPIVPLHVGLRTCLVGNILLSQAHKL